MGETMSDELITRVEETLDKDEEQLKDDLPDLLNDIQGQEKELITENPEVFAKVIGRMDDIDIASFYEDEPEAGNQFQDLLWTGVNVLVEENPEIKDQIAADITANFEADDCPMEGHLDVNAGEETITGGSGPVADPDLTLTGPADTLTGLITGGIDPVQGFMQQQYELDGSVQKGTQLASVMGEITDNVPN
ncbi:SCP-2 sterol transfer family protein [Halorientalis regularis]|jgi:putative sterol carrier protein|uniref:SCP-2 sterol transfer family protein n=2 Tax=Halorientalis regularis TaxID=660518 RepID=A0A1G7IQR1_9EURY|nr:SCP-2 sterol transfer family protein [Halorientalis regularis]